MTLRERIGELPRAAWLRLGLFVTLFVIAFLVIVLGGAPSVSAAREWVSARGTLAPVVFVIGFAVLTVTPFPKSILAVVGGALWGMWPGLAICMAAVVLGASMSFFIGRRLIGDSVRTLAGPHMREVDAAVQRSFLAVLAIRIMPVLPFTLLNYAFGVTALRYSTFALATAIGSTPGTAAYVLVGASGVDIASWQFWAALAVLSAVSLAAAIVAARRRRRHG